MTVISTGEAKGCSRLLLRPSTVGLLLVKQGKFRGRVPMIERDCESNDDLLDGEIGLLLTPTVDHLFGRGFKP